jgi:hypothetical protein
MDAWTPKCDLFWANRRPRQPLLAGPLRQSHQKSILLEAPGRASSVEAEAVTKRVTAQ